MHVILQIIAIAKAGMNYLVNVFIDCFYISPYIQLGFSDCFNREF